MTQQVYHYHLQARRPLTYLALGVGIVTAYAVYLTGAVLAVVPVGAFMIIVIYRLLMNHSAGMRLGPTRLEIYNGRQSKILPLAKIKSAKITRHLLSPYDCVLELSDGMRDTLPPAALPSARRLEHELSQRDIPVLR
ncbi:hypothetical protein [Phaeovulum sp.]|uniref:hypothetical protein n=1 Tax=Phaeovulum sp. TaxID=2934796 RepID=UPI0039E55916